MAKTLTDANLRTDKIDEKIISILQADARLSFRDVAKKAGVSVVTVLKRVRRLEKENIISGYCVQLDYDRLGFDVPVLIRIRIAKGMLFEVEKKIANHPNVSAIYDITGDFDAAIIARFRNRRSLDSFLKQIQGYDFLIKTETNLILNRIKEKSIKL